MRGPLRNRTDTNRANPSTCVRSHGCRSCKRTRTRHNRSTHARVLLQIPEQAHSRALQAALVRNSHTIPELVSRHTALQHALQQPDAAPHSPSLPRVGDFLDAEQHARWLRQEAVACGAAIEALQRRPAFSGVLHVDVQSIVALQAGRRRSKVGRMFKCCAAPPQTGAGALYLKVWLHGNGDDKASQQCALRDLVLACARGLAHGTSHSCALRSEPAKS